MTRIIKDIPITTNEDGETVFESTVILEGGVILSGTASITITSNVNDLVVPDLENASVLRITSTVANRRITGIVNPNVGKETSLQVFNVGDEDLLIRNNDNNSDPENRFLMSGNERLNPNEGMIIVYDVIDSRWRLSSVYQ